MTDLKTKATCNTISVVWNYFRLKADPEGHSTVKECGSLVCKVCVKSFQQRVGILVVTYSHI